MKIEVFAEDPESGFKEKVSTFVIDGIEEVANYEVAKKEDSTNPKITLSFELTRSSLLQISKAETSIVETYIVEEKPKKSTNTTTETS